MALPPDTLSWLREQETAVDTRREPQDTAKTAERLLETAHLTPAWVQPYRDLVVRLADQLDGDSSTEATSVHDSLQNILALAESCPQVVGVDFPALALTRAEWLHGNLHVEVDAESATAGRRTMFRIVDAEPRVWELNGIEGASMEFTQAAVLVSFPCVSGELEFVAGSY